MDDRPLTFIVRLWLQADGFRAELKPLQGGDALYFKSALELVTYLEERPRILLTNESLDA